MKSNTDGHRTTYRLPTKVYSRLREPIQDLLITAVLLGIVAVEPALAQGTGDAFCDSELAKTVKNLFTVIQFGGPLIGGVLAVGATVFLPVVRRADAKREIKEVRNQGVVWGVIVAPLATSILQFILNSVVTGGASCGF